MEAVPFVCPSCNALVRHDWTDECKNCGASLVSIPPGQTAAVDPTVRPLNPQPSIAPDTAKTPRHPVGIIMGVVILALVAGGVFTLYRNSSAPSPIAVVQATHEAAPAPERWVTSTDRDGRYVANMPAEPTPITVTADGKTATGLTGNYNGVLYGITAFPLDDATASAGFKERWDIVSSSGQVETESKGVFNGGDYREATLIVSSTSHTKVRLFSSNKNVYVLKVQGDSDSNLDGPLQTLVNGFRLAEKG